MFTWKCTNALPRAFVKVNIKPMWKINIENVPVLLCKSPWGNRKSKMITKYELVLLYKAQYEAAMILMLDYIETDNCESRIQGLMLA